MFCRAISRQIFSTILAAAFLVSAAYSQDPLPDSPNKQGKEEPPKVFTRDELEAIQVAGAFSRDLQRTKDLKPLLAKYGVSDYGSSLARTGYLMEQEIVSEELLLTIDAKAMRDLHFTLQNWLYLCVTWAMHQDKLDEYEDLLKPPPDVMKVIQKEPFLARAFDFEAEDKDEIHVSSKEKLSRVVNTLEQTALLFRTKLVQFPQRKTRTYLSNLALMTGDGEFLHKPTTNTCTTEEGCFGIPKGKEYFEVNIEPLFTVVLVRSSGRMKIAYFGLANLD